MELLLREAEEQIEAWWCELDEAWHVRMGEADAIVAAARDEAARILAEAEELAGEHHVVLDELVSLRDAVNRLRSELSRVVDAAFDAIPAVEATADAIDKALEPRRGLVRRLLRR